MRNLTPILLLFPSLSHAFCFDKAGQHYNVDPDLLKAIATQESSLNANATNANKNKYGDVVSRDYGLMQINSSWFKQLSKFNVNTGTVMQPCFNVHLGAWVLASNFSTHGYNWNSVGAYNAGFKASKQQLRDEYVTKIKQHYLNIKSSKNNPSHSKALIHQRRSLIQ